MTVLTLAMDMQIQGFQRIGSDTDSDTNQLTQGSGYAVVI